MGLSWAQAKCDTIILSAMSRERLKDEAIPDIWTLFLGCAGLYVSISVDQAEVQQAPYVREVVGG